MLSFYDFMQESFDIKTEPTKHTIKQQKELYYRYLLQFKTDSMAKRIADNIFSMTADLTIYEVESNSVRYIVFLYKENDIYEIHFNDYNSPEEFGDLKKRITPPMGLFGDIFNIVYYKCLKNGQDVKIPLNTESNRNSLYVKMINKIIKQHNLSYVVDSDNGDITLTYKEQTK